MKNYYEILEVDKNASSEVIEKAYKTLAKKYHPDLQQGAQKYEAAEKMKIINQAYDVLSDDAKRAEYNQRLEAQRIEEDRRRAEAIARQQQERVAQQNYQQRQQVDEGTIINMSRMLEQQMRAARNQAYQDAYIQNLRSRGYKIRYKRDFKYYLKAIKVIGITVIVCFLIYQLPFVKNFFANLYQENTIFQVIVNIFTNTFSTKL